MNEELRTLLSKPTASVQEVGRVCFELGKNASYAAVKAGHIPTIRIGGGYRVPTIALKKMLGIRGMTWTTRLDPALNQRYGYGPEAHAAWFVPRTRPAPPRNAISFLIPECEMQFVVPRAGVMINRPQANKNVKSWLKYACREASDQNAVLILVCDTAEQVERATKMAGKLLPKHERAALERIYEEQARVGLH